MIDFDLFIRATATGSWYSMQILVVKKEGGVEFCVTNIDIYQYFQKNVNRNILLSQINTMSNQYNNTLLTTTTVSYSSPSPLLTLGIGLQRELKDDEITED